MLPSRGDEKDVIHLKITRSRVVAVLEWPAQSDSEEGLTTLELRCKRLGESGGTRTALRLVDANTQVFHGGHRPFAVTVPEVNPYTVPVWVCSYRVGHEEGK